MKVLSYDNSMNVFTKSLQDLSLNIAQNQLIFHFV